jgi:TonB family protein
MNPILIYIVKVNLAIALFYLFYKLFFASDTLWKTRRLYLLFSIAASFLYQLMSIQKWIEKQQPVKEIVSNYVALQEFTITANENPVFITLENVIYSIYGIVVLILIVRLIIQLFSILKLKIVGKKQLIQGVEVVVLKKPITPFSFFGTVYMNPELHTDDEKQQILMHELTHVRQLHSVDVVLSELLCIAFWMNPATWLLKREIRQNLEYLADNQVIESGVDTKSYQYHLLQLSYQCPDYKLSNKFNILPIKKRIIMMNQQKSRKSSALKYMLIAPLTLTLVFLSNVETFASSIKQITQNKTVTAPVKEIVTSTNEPSKLDEVVVVGYAQQEEKKKTELAPPPPPPAKNNDEITPPPPPPALNDKVVFQVVEKMPQFPGGDKALFDYLGTNVRYPVKAQENGIQGRVICSFVISKTGEVDSVKVLRKIDPFLDAEAVRVIRNMPKWIPGEQRGEKVNVQYTLPISFKLDGGKNKTQTIGNPNPPLIVVDGEVMSAAFNMNSIKPENIATIDVLKDASATAVYGEKGKNGVVLIRTKK